MNSIQNANFFFEDYKITKYSFDIPSNDSEEELSIDVKPSGIYFQNEGRYKLFILFEVINAETKESVINLSLEASFKFQNNIPFSELPLYFYKNVIAIVFPYIRAFISTLTLQANHKLLVLPILNLSMLDKDLIESTIAQ